MAYQGETNSNRNNLNEHKGIEKEKRTTKTAREQLMKQILTLKYQLEILIVKKKNNIKENF